MSAVKLIELLNGIEEGTPQEVRLFLDRGDIFVNGIECKDWHLPLRPTDVITRYTNGANRLVASCGKVGTILSQNEDCCAYIRMQQFLANKATQKDTVEGRVARTILKETWHVNGPEFWKAMRTAIDAIENAVSSVNVELAEITGE